MTDVYGWVPPKDQKDTYQVVRIKETFRRGKRTHYLKIEVHSCYYLLNMQEGNMAFSNFFSGGGGNEESRIRKVKGKLGHPEVSLMFETKILLLCVKTFTFHFKLF